MTTALAPLAGSHRRAVIDIYNHYVDHGFASYRETRLPYEAFDRFQEIARGFPAYVCVGDAGAVNGFGFLHAWHPSECFRRTAEITYFLHPGATRQGIGSLLLDRILVEAKAMEIDSVLASISSRNSESLAFHRRHGFQECGCFPRIGRKHGEDFGVIWLLRQL